MKFHWRPLLGVALAGLGRGAEDLRQGPGLPPPRPVGGDRGRATSPSTSSACSSIPRGRRVRVRRSTCSTRPRSSRRRSCRCSPVGQDGPQPQPGQLLRRDRAGRLLRRQRRARHRLHQRPAAAGAAVLLPRHAADPARRAELRPDPDQPAARPGAQPPAGRLPPAPHPDRAGPTTTRTRSAAAARWCRARRRGFVHHYPERVDGLKVRERAARRSPTTTARRRCSGTAWPTGRRSTSSRRTGSSSARSTTMHIRERMVEHLNHDRPRPRRRRRGRASAWPRRRRTVANHGRSLTGAEPGPRSRQRRRRPQGRRPRRRRGRPRQRATGARHADRRPGATCELLAPVDGDGATPPTAATLPVDRAMNTVASVLYDAVVVADGDDGVDGVRSKGELANSSPRPTSTPSRSPRSARACALLHELDLPGAELAPADGGFVDDAGVVTLVGGDADEPGEVRRRLRRRDRRPPYTTTGRSSVSGPDVHGRDRARARSWVSPRSGP